MATILHGKSDSIVIAIKSALDAYERQFPGSKAEVYRQNSASVRVRVIDQRFAALSRADRHDQVWDFLTAHAGEDTVAEVSVLLPLTPHELKDSLANYDFEHPLPSNL
jgi:stress-induced morphogen